MLMWIIDRAYYSTARLIHTADVRKIVRIIQACELSEPSNITLQRVVYGTIMQII